jgi:hypothetical protein
MHDSRGAVYVEFLIAFPSVFLMFLATVQLAILGTAELAVRHAAAVGARAAIVVLPEAPERYGGAPRGQIAAPRPGTEAALPVRAGAGDAASGAPSLELASPPPSHGGGRMGAIRRAVTLVLAPYAPNWSLGAAGAGGAVLGASVASVVEGSVLRLMLGLTVYPDAAVSVTLPTRPGGQEVHREMVRGERVTVRVSYLAACTVPVVARAICRGGGGVLARLGDPSHGGTRPELEGLPSAESLGHLLKLGARFWVLRAEATLPIQWAGYEEG